jgi:sugar phosphate isomerase/epimerase
MSLCSLLFLSAALKPHPTSFYMSVQAWSFNPYSVFESIERASEAGSKYIEFFPGQKLKTGSNSGMGPNLSESETQELHSQLNKFGVTPIAYGVTGIDADYLKAKPLFVWAKSMGIKVLNTESTGSIDTIEKLVREFDIKVGFHNHPKQPNNPSYKMWDPTYVYSVVKDRDARIGSCAEIGHWVRSGIKPIEALNMLHGRIVSSHLKDLNKFGDGAQDVPYGTGVSDIPSILAFYDKMGLKGSVSVEYEYRYDANVNYVAQCVGFVRGYFGK